MKLIYQIFLGMLMLLLLSPTAWSGNLSIPNQFQSGTPAIAGEVNTNFDAVQTEVNDNDTRITALEDVRTTSVTLLASTFKPTDETITYSTAITSNGVLYETTGSFIHHLPVPKNATVTSIDAYVYDNTATGHITVELRRYYSNMSNTVVARAETTDTETGCTPCVKSSAGINHVIDSDTWASYILHIDITESSATALGIYTVKVNYEYTL